jgi:curved DNA-binding protein CbpA
MTESYYDLLGVAPDATTEEIEQAYRERLLQTHPDVNDADDAAARTRRLIQAREVLTDGTERDRYDRLGHEGYVGRSGLQDHDLGSGQTASQGSGTEDDGDRDGGGTADASTDGWTREGVDSRHQTGADGDTGRADAGSDPPGGTSVGSARDAGRYPSDSWAGGGGTSDGGAAYTTRETGLHRSRFLPGSQSIVLLSATFLLYPVVLWGVAFSPFPLAVNLALVVCAVGVVAFLQSMPEVGIAVFGIWSTLTPPGLLVLGVAPLSVPGVVAVLGTMLPLGLCLLTRAVVRP